MKRKREFESLESAVVEDSVHYMTINEYIC